MSAFAPQPPALDRFWMGAYGGRITQQVARATAAPPGVPQIGYVPRPQFTTATAALAWDAARQRESQLAALRWPSAQRFDPAFWTSGAAPDPLRVAGPGVLRRDCAARSSRTRSLWPRETHPNQRDQSTEAFCCPLGRLVCCGGPRGGDLGAHHGRAMGSRT